MVSQSSVHGAIDGRACFKCGQGVGQANGVRYLGHDWCANCARGEAQARMPRAASAETTNGGKPAETPPLKDLPAAMQSMLKTMPMLSARGAGSSLGVACALGGPALLVIGLGLTFAFPATAMAGPTLTLSGAILMSAVVRRR